MNTLLRILLVEDNPGDVDLIKEMLTETGAVSFSVESAQNLSEAMVRLKGSDIDLVLLDLGLPDSSGIDTFLKLRAAVPEVPIIILTGNTDQNDAVAAIGAGAEDFIIKGDIRGSLIVRAIRYALERKKAEEMLRESQHLVEGIINAIPVRVFWKDKNLVYFGCNAAFARDAGFANPKDIIGKDDYQMGWRDQAELYRNDDRQVIECDVTKYLIEEPQTTPEGNTITLLTSKLPMRNSKGEISGVLGTYIDITERKKTEEALRESGEFNRQIIESAQEGLIVYGLDLKYQVWNSFMERLTGLAASEVLGKHPLEVFPFLHESRVLAGIERAMKGETILAERFPFHVPVTGMSGWTSDISAPLRNASGDIIGVIGTVRDITEYVRAEETLKEEKIFIENTLNTLKDIFFVFDLEGKFLRWNKTMNAVSGYIDMEIALMKPADFFRKDDKERISGAIREAVKEGSACIDAILFTKDGRQIPYEFGVGLLRNNKGNFIGISGIGRDLTERKRAEEEKSKLEDQFRQSQKMEAVGQLAGGIAHDFNNILSAIIGYGYVTLMKMAKDDPLRMNIEKMLEASDRAAELIKSILAFSRKQIIDRRTVDLNELVRKVEKFLVKIIGEDISINITLSKSGINVFADSGQIEQVLINLATNARDAMSKGGRLNVKTSVTELDNGFINEHGFGNRGKFAVISVSDSGIGMDEQTRKQIFEPFFTTKEIGKGTGLGLAMAYGIIKQHDGYINVYSEPGKGTTFRIYLPVIASGVSEGKKAPEAELPERGCETILLAEDDEQVRVFIELVLQEFGYDVIIANDGEDAVKKFMENKDRVQLLLFDLVMPKKSGKEAYDEIRAMKPDVKIIFSSGYAHDIIYQKGLIDDGISIISKPASPVAILRKVRSVLDENKN